MGSSKQTQKTDMGPWGPTQGPLTNNAIPRIESQYQADASNPDRLAPQAAGYGADVLSGKYLDPSTNPHLAGLTNAIWGQVAPQISSVFSRAGRGTSASASGLGGALTQGFTTALAQPLFAQYNQERANQQAMAGQAASIDATQSLPLEQYLERLRSIAALGQKGSTTTTATPSPLQTIAGIGLTAAGLGNSMFAGGANSAAAGLSAMFSDRRLKVDIEPIGADPRGWGVYSFRYLWDEPGTRRVGVMAQEVAPIVPEAVSRHPSGWLMVNYGAL